MLDSIGLISLLINLPEVVMLIALQVTALILIAFTWALSLAHALEYPGKLRLDREQYLAVQRIYYPGFTCAGAAEPIAVLVLAALLVLTPAGSLSFWLTAGALIGTGVTHGLYWVWTAPVNKVWLGNEPLSRGAERFFRPTGRRTLPTEWTLLRTRWEHSHICRAVSASVAFLLMIVVAISRA